MSAPLYIRLKALYAVEALHEANLDGITGFISERAYDRLIEAKEMSQCRAKARRVLYLLGFDEAPTPQVDVEGVSSNPCACEQITHCVSWFRGCLWAISWLRI